MFHPTILFLNKIFYSVFFDNNKLLEMNLNKTLQIKSDDTTNVFQNVNTILSIFSRLSLLSILHLLCYKIYFLILKIKKK